MFHNLINRYDSVYRFCTLYTFKQRVCLYSGIMLKGPNYLLLVYQMFELNGVLETIIIYVQTSYSEITLSRYFILDYTRVNISLSPFFS